MINGTRFALTARTPRGVEPERRISPLHVATWLLALPPWRLRSSSPGCGFEEELPLPSPSPSPSPSLVCEIDSSASVATISQKALFSPPPLQVLAGCVRVSASQSGRLSIHHPPPYQLDDLAAKFCQSGFSAALKRGWLRGPKTALSSRRARPSRLRLEIALAPERERFRYPHSPEQV